MQSLVLGLTGGIASGKSSVARWLAGRGVPVLDADHIARRVVEPGQPALTAIRQAFGSAVINPDGTLNRSALARLVFADPSARRQLEAMVHPAVLSQLEADAKRLKEAGERLIVLDIPLLYEVGPAARRLVDRVVVVYVDEQTQLDRLQRRDGLDEASARQRVAAQLPLAEKVRRADDVIDNSGAWEETERQLTQLFKFWWDLVEDGAERNGDTCYG